MYILLDDRLGFIRVKGVFSTIKKVNNTIRDIWKKDNTWRKETGNQTYTLGEFKKYFYTRKAVIDKIMEV